MTTRKDDLQDAHTLVSGTVDDHVKWFETIHVDQKRRHLEEQHDTVIPKRAGGTLHARHHQLHTAMGSAETMKSDDAAMPAPPRRVVVLILVDPSPPDVGKLAQYAAFDLEGKDPVLVHGHESTIGTIIERMFRG